MTPAQSAQAHRSAGGVFFLAPFGTAWVLAGLGLGEGFTLSRGVCVALILAIMMCAAWRVRRRSSPPARGADASRMRRFRQINIVQWAAVAVAATAATLLRRPDLIPVLISLVVALHFLPLAGLFNAPVYYLTAPVIILLDIAALIAHPRSCAPMAALCTGAVLLLTGVIRLAAARRLVVARSTPADHSEAVATE